MNDFSRGDIVQLKSGGPKMTVDEIGMYEGKIKVRWFAGSKMESATVDPETVEIYVEPQK